MNLPEHWAVERKAFRDWLDEVEEAELEAGSDVVDAMIAKLAAGEEVEPFQFSAETERKEEQYRVLIWMDRWLAGL